MSNQLKLIKGLMLIGLGVLILIGLWRFGTILGFLLVYPWIVSKVTGIVINPHLVNIVALVITSILYFGVYRGIYRKNKNWGYATMIGLMILQSAFMFIAEKDRFFSVTSGEVLKYYTTNPLNGELQVFDAPIYDAFGQKAEPVDFKTAQEIYQQQNGEKYPNNEVAFGEIKNFFDKRTGRALVYYRQDTSGYHFFIHDGYDPISGESLLPVTSAVALEAQRIQPLKPSGLSTVAPASKVTETRNVNSKTTKSIWTDENFIMLVFGVVSILALCLIGIVAMGYSGYPFSGSMKRNDQPRLNQRKFRRGTLDSSTIPEEVSAPEDSEEVVVPEDPDEEYRRYLLGVQTIDRGYRINTSSFQNEAYRFDLDMRLIRRGWRITPSNYSNGDYAYRLNSALIAHGWRVAI